MESRSREWTMIISYPMEKGYTHDRIRDLLGSLESIKYWCMADEIASVSAMYHTHIYFICTKAIRYRTIKDKFPDAHIDMAKGTTQGNRNYVFKEGYFEKERAYETNLPETHEEYGQIPIED